MNVVPVNFPFFETAIRLQRPDSTMIMHLMSLGTCSNIYRLLEVAYDNEFYQLSRVIEPDRSLPPRGMPIYNQAYITCCYYSPCCIFSRHCHNFGTGQLNASDHELCYRCWSACFTCCTGTPFLACLEVSCCYTNVIEDICHWCYPRERLHVSEDGQQWYVDYVPATCCKVPC